jgi:RHS repeat-associated protein
VDDLILRLEPDIVQPLYALRDQWNVVAVTDSSAAAQERYGYNAFGTTLFMTASFGSISESSFGWETTFCGYRLDGETGFYQVRYRYLHPTLGRWLSRDPLGELWFELTMKTLSPDGTGDRNSTRALLDEEGGFNLYSYVTNNSSNRVDQLGLAGDYMPPYPGPRSAPPKMPCPWRDCWKNCMMQNGANWALGVLGASTLGGGTIPKLITAGMPQGGITNTWSAASLILKKLGVLPLNNPVLRNIGDEVNPALTAAQVAALSFLIGLSNSCGAICSGNSSAY